VWTETSWLGVQVLKPVTDLWLYQEIISLERPNAILETGTFAGGSALYFASIMDLVGLDGLVVSVDTQAKRLSHHPKIRYLVGSSTDQATKDAVVSLVPAGFGLVCLDSDHSASHVREELEMLSPLATDILVVEDTFTSEAGDAVRDWLATNPPFQVDDHLQEKFLSTFHTWLRRIK
jgi:cephalosporin hydroxylase